MTIHKVLHLRDDIDTLHVRRKEGERGFACIEDIVDASIRAVEDCFKKSKEGSIITTSKAGTR